MARIVSGDSGTREVVAALRSGQVVGLPTETVYGLAADIRNEAGLLKIFTVKRRPVTHPLIIHIARPEELEDLALEINPVCRALVDVCWPGPLTVIIRAAPHVSRLCTGGRDTVAVRLPAHPLTQKVIRQLGSPVAAPSANRFGDVSPTTAQHVVDDLGNDINLVLNGGSCEVGVESTVVDCTLAQPEILRHGAITPEDVQRILSTCATTLATAVSGSSRAPGMLDRHYAPKARLVLHERDTTVPQDGAPVLRCDGDLVEVARLLYDQLRGLDARHITLAHVVMPPTAGLGFAIRDRLTKAAAGVLSFPTQSCSLPLTNRDGQMPSHS